MGIAGGGYMPHVALLLRAMRITRERLEGDGKIAVDAGLLRALVEAAVAAKPFSAEFYCSSYPDVAAAHACGRLPDLHRHFVERGFLEGRLGASAAVDEAFYAATYPDVAGALLAGAVTSGAEHYLRTGAAEGRLPNAASQPEIEGWTALLREHQVR